MTEPKNPPLVPPDSPGPMLERSGVAEVPNHRDFLPPTQLEQPGAIRVFRNPDLLAGSGDDGTPTPPLRTPTVDSAQSGPLGEIRNPELVADKHGNAIRNPPLSPPDRPGYDSVELFGTPDTVD